LPVFAEQDVSAPQRRLDGLEDTRLVSGFEQPVHMHIKAHDANASPRMKNRRRRAGDEKILSGNAIFVRINQNFRLSAGWCKIPVGAGFVVINVGLETDPASMAIPERHEPPTLIVARRAGKHGITAVQGVRLPNRPNPKQTGIRHQDPSHDIIKQAAVGKT
jgi:hypothetical protein